MSREVIEWLLSTLKLNAIIMRIIRQNVKDDIAYDIREEFVEWLFERLKRVYSIIGAEDECLELRKVLEREIADEDQRELLARYIIELLYEFITMKRLKISKFEEEKLLLEAYT